MKLIHCADLHLDSPMEANLSTEKARERLKGLREFFRKIARCVAACVAIFKDSAEK